MNGSKIIYDDPSPWSRLIINNNETIMWLETPRCGSASIKNFINKSAFLFLDDALMHQRQLENICQTISEWIQMVME